MRKGKEHALVFEEDDGKPDIWHRLFRIVIACFILAVIAGALSMFLPLMKSHREIDRELVELTTKRDERAAQHDEVQRRLTWLRSDPGFLESVARDRLDLRKDGETVIRIERPVEGE